ncbi:caspase family protein [Bradyrhizobium manausense]|uniref:caspase family protein n=1 Tax=Bradyrhizobium manausense TaxID=989370 RepID=UPI001BA8138E|nr:caspase family protein [Bradyrhizobium manausense]MBR0793142.1 caspase family protein [Bradyrhizobium manausense]
MASRIGIIARLISTVLLACAATAAQAEKRVALVIGNSAYQTVAKLPNPADDARLMADTLLSLGFFVVGGGAQIDLDKAGFDRALQTFDKELIGADVALFYFAGHGVETHGLNYIVPVDAHPADEGDVFVQAIGLAGILDRMEKSGARINLMLLDACRNNPFGGHAMSATADGLAQMQAPPGTLISFATQPHSVALDGDGGHSPYTRALTETMRHPGYGLFRTFNEMGLAVEKATHGEQLPWVATSPISTSFYFAGKTVPPSATQVALAPQTNATPAQLSEQALRRDLITDCDRLAMMPYDTLGAVGVAATPFEKMKPAEATAACNDAMQRYPDVARFAYEAGRAATARKDYADALHLFEKAAAAGYPPAMHNIGVLYATGEGVKTDKTEAARWYKKASDAGDPLGMLELGWIYAFSDGAARNCPEAIRLNEAAVKAGVGAAMNNLGLLYVRGRCVERDYAEARRLFEQGAALNDDAALNSLGSMYNEAQGVPRNTRLARELFERSAAQGYALARQNLHDMRR